MQEVRALVREGRLLQDDLNTTATVDLKVTMRDGTVLGQVNTQCPAATVHGCGSDRLMHAKDLERAEFRRGSMLATRRCFCRSSSLLTSIN